jgi:TonB-linked SusC/RagA family outer membrane protein
VSQTGSVTGTVTEASSGRPLGNAQVSIPGTGIGGLTGVNGRFLLLNVPPGEYTVEAQLIGYATAEQTVTVAADGAATVALTLERSAIELGEIVITGAGQATERRRLGNTVEALSVSEIENAPVVSASEVLQARIPGVDVNTTGGHAGSGSQIRIRGVGSLSQTNGPVIYVDGVRVNGGEGVFGSAASPSRLDDLNPSNIERIEVLKGAAAATLYGTEASNGVIQIFTKRGQSGASRWTFSASAGIATHMEEPDLAGFAVDQSPTAGRDFGTTQLNQFYGADNEPFDLYIQDYDYAMFETGQYQDYSLSNSGGNEQLTYFVVGRYAFEDGVLGGKDCVLPSGYSDCFTVPGFETFEDTNETKQVDAALTFQPVDNLRLEFTSRYIDRQVNPQDNTGGGPATLQLSKPEEASDVNDFGVQIFNTTKEGFQVRWEDRTERFGGSFKAGYSFTPNLSLNVTTGLDVIRTTALFTRPFGHAVDGFSNFQPRGIRQVTNWNRNEYTVDATANWEHEISPDLTSSLVVGSQILISDQQEVEAEGEEFPGPGIEVVGGANIQRTTEEIERTVNNGVFIQEQLGFRNFFFLTGGARLDRHSAFGENADAAFYPKVSASLVVSDLPGWNGFGPVSTLRFRGALGKSGLQPGSFDRFSTFAPASSFLGPSLQPSNLGNPDLKPEVSTEWEVGFEAGLFSDRVAVEATYWDRTTNDLLIARQFPVSGGFSETQLDNIGEMVAHGLDLGISGVVYQSGNVAVDVFANGAYLFQEVTDLGGVLPIRQSSIRNLGVIREGYSPQSQFGGQLIDAEYPYDLNGTGQAASREDMLDFLSNASWCPNLGTQTFCNTVESLESLLMGVPGLDGTLTDNYLGKSVPDWQGAFGANITIGDLTLTNNFAYKAGKYHVTNHTMAFRNGNRSIGRNWELPARYESVLMNPASTAEERLEAAMWFRDNAHSLGSRLNGLNRVHPADFIRWREMSLTWNVPQDLANSIGADGLTVTASGRNLYLWSRYKDFYGLDPETVQRDNIHGGHDAHIIATPRRFGLSIRVNF